MTSHVGQTNEFKFWSLKERGRLLKGRFAHFCNDWDGLTVDETCMEAASCHDVDYDDEARASIAAAVEEFNRMDPFSTRPRRSS